MSPSAVPGHGPHRASVGTVLALPELPCTQCGGPHLLDRDTGWAVCGNADCSAAGLDVPLWRVLDAHVAAGCGPDLNPAGLPRPVERGRPIPWLTPVVPGLGALWRMLHRGRLAAAQLTWLCQVCGTPADAANSVAVTNESGWCLTSAPLHPACAEAAARYCPAVARTGTVVALVRGGESRFGDVDPSGLFTQEWQI